ncbi:MAG: hypothetical protein ACPGJV_13945 [Bacteriovoracaceae bacterium]
MKFEYRQKGCPQVCETILRSIPDWFGIEESTVAYCEIKDPVCDLIMVQAKDWAKRTHWSVERSMDN